MFEYVISNPLMIYWLICRIPTLRNDQLLQVEMPCFIKQNQGLTVKGSVHSRPSKVFCNAASLEEEFSAIQSKNFSKDEESLDSETLPEETTVERLPTSEEVSYLGLDD